jgi:AAA+ ATPase superfamily predicted ATPase
MVVMRINPFVFGKIVKGQYFLDRKDERKELISEIENHTNIILYAPRRYGKTSLVLKVFEDLKKKKKSFVGLFIDLYTINSKEKFIISLTNEYGKNSGFTFNKLLKFLKNSIRDISPSIEIDQFGNPKINLQFNHRKMERVFDDVINLPKILADDGKLVSVFLDEFQEIAKLNGENFQKELRAAIQHHDNVSYIFSGSKFHLFRDIFQNRNNPLYHIGKSMSLRPIQERFYSRYILRELQKVHSKFDGDSVSEIYRIATGIPYYVQMLSHETYNLALLNKNSRPIDLVNLATENIIANKNDEFLLLFENLNRSSKMALDAIIHHQGKELFRKEILAESTLAASTLKKALDTLIQKGIIYRLESTYTFQDVFFQRWLERRSIYF